MPPSDPPSGGIFQSLRALWTTGLALVQNRVELLGVEIEEQKARLVRVLLLAGAAIFLANTALLVLTAAVVLLAGENARLGVLIGLSVLYLVVALIAFLALRKELRSGPPPFSGTISELKKDCDWLDPRN